MYRVCSEIPENMLCVVLECFVCTPVQYIYIYIYCILRGRIKGFNRSITTILFEVGSYRTVAG